MKSSTIQIIVTGIFLVFGVVGVIVFSVSSTKKTQTASDVRVTVWGILPEKSIKPVIEEANTKAPGSINMTYVEKETPEILEEDLIEALLENKNIPDGLIIQEDMLVSLQKRLTLIAWTAISERDLKNSYTQAGEIFMTPTGTYAVPFLIDPLVLYWNRDIFNSALVTNPPATWQDLVTLAPTFIERNSNKTISKTAIALGEYANIAHAKEILAALSLQVGSGFVRREQESFESNVLETTSASPENPPLETALTFFTQFADPASILFSWSRALPDDLLMFLRGDSAMYIGFGSEARSIREKNPNLNFDIAPLPQTKDAPKKTTFAHVYGIAIPAASPNKQAMLNTALILTSTAFQEAFSGANNLAPVRRELLANPAGSAVLDVIYKSSLWGASWLDPRSELSERLFKDMIESVTGGKFRSEEAVLNFEESLKQTLDEIK